MLTICVWCGGSNPQFGTIIWTAWHCTKSYRCFNVPQIADKTGTPSVVLVLSFPSRLTNLSLTFRSLFKITLGLNVNWSGMTHLQFPLPPPKRFSSPLQDSWVQRNKMLRGWSSKNPFFFSWPLAILSLINLPQFWFSFHSVRFNRRTIHHYSCAKQNPPGFLYWQVHVAHHSVEPGCDVCTHLHLRRFASSHQSLGLHVKRKLIFCLNNTTWLFYRSLRSARDVPANAGFLCDRTAVIGDRVKGTLSLWYSSPPNF